MRRDDELDALRAAWERLEAPAPERALEEPDEATRAAVEWMRAAWAALEPPPVAVPAPIPPRVQEARGAHAHRRWPLLGALAALLAALAAAGLWAGLEHPAREGTETVVGVLTGPIAEQGPSGGGGRPDPAASTGATEQADETDETDETSPAAREDGPSGAVQVAALSAGHMELRSGPVRLILLTDTAHAKGVRERDDG